MRVSGRFKALAAMAAVVSMSAAGAFAQSANTAYVPFVVNANATVTAVQGAEVVSMTVTANEEKVLVLPRGITSVLNPGGMQERLNAPMVTGSRGNITLRLPPQSYQNAEIALHSVNGKRVLRAKAAASEAGSAISRRNVAAGAYLLSVKGTNGGAFTTRLTHGGGDLSIRVAFGAGSVSPERRLEKQAADGDWEITVVADGYITYTYTLRAVVGINETQFINLDPAPQAQTYTITFNQNYTGAPAATTVRTGTDGKLASLPTPTRSGYTFNGWWTVSAATGGTQVTTGTTFSADATIYARWEEGAVQPTNYTLTVSRSTTAGGSVSVKVGTGTAQSNPAAQSVASGTSVIVTATPGTGYTFVNWTAATGTTLPTGITATAATGTFTISGNVNITANFKTEDVTPPPVITTFTDERDGKTYKKVVIGTQTWMGQNLNYDVPNNTSDVCYGNSADNCAKYGRLYNWAIAMGGASSSSLSPSGVQGLCPAGWHIPSDAEWTTLTDFVGGASTAGTKLKSSTGWNSYGGVPVGTDQYGFAALPGGRGDSDGSFYSASHGFWWSATEEDAANAKERSMYCDWERVSRNGVGKASRFSVRCVEGAVVQPPTAYTITFNQNYTGAPTATTAKTGTDGKLASLPTPTRRGYTFTGWWTVSTNTGGTQVTTSTIFSANATIYARWQGCTLTVTRNPTAGGTTSPASSQSNIPSDTAVNIRATAGSNYNFVNWRVTSGAATIANADSAATTVTLTSDATIRANFQLKDNLFIDSRDNKVYKKITIGTQTWMAENLNYNVDGSIECYRTVSSNCDEYGRLYWWNSADIACPAGWHLPSDAEWTTLTNYVGSNAGTKLKSTSGWYASGNGTDDYGFSAIPSGYRGSGADGPHWEGAGKEGTWWSATVYGPENWKAWRRSVNYNDGGVYRDYLPMGYMFSVRCVQD